MKNIRNLYLKEESTFKLVICGIRGIPACYGGFETFAEELSMRLVKLGHQVTVYGRKHVINYREAFYRGVEIRLYPAPRHKYLETPVHSLLCFLNLAFTERQLLPDLVLVCNAANSPFIWLLRLRGIPVVLNVDGIERKRAKWNFLGKLWYRIGEICGVLFATRLVADAKVIQEYYQKTYRASSTVISYGRMETDAKLITEKLGGADLSNVANEGKQLFSDLGLIPTKYILYCSRLEPENNAHVVIEAFKLFLDLTGSRELPLLIVGDAPYAKTYVEELKKLAYGHPIIFAGYRFGRSYQLLQLYAFCYIQATEVGGTHPALVEAMGYGNCIIANKTPENEEVLGDAGLYYEKNNSKELSVRLAELFKNSDLRGKMQSKAYERSGAYYNWDKIVSDYEKLFRDLLH